MNFKVFVAVFGLLLAVQASTQSPALKDDSIKVIVIQIFNKVLDDANQLLQKANAAVDDIEKNADKIKTDIIAKVVAEAKKVNAVIVEVLDDLKSTATDNGKAVIDCLEKEKDKTEAAFEKSATDFGTCAAGETSVVIAGLKDVLSQLNTLVTDVKGPVDQLSSCSADEMTCLVTFATAEVAVAKKVPAVVKEDLTKLKDMVEKIAADTSGCAKSVVDGIKTSAKDIFNEAVVCIKG